MFCRACNVGNRPEDLSVLVVHPDGRNEPHAEGHLCEGCLESRKEEFAGDPGAIRAVEPVVREGERA